MIRNMVLFCENYLRSVASKEVADFKMNVELQTTQFTKFEVHVYTNGEYECYVTCMACLCIYMYVFTLTLIDKIS